MVNACLSSSFLRFNNPRTPFFQRDGGKSGFFDTENFLTGFFQLSPPTLLIIIPTGLNFSNQVLPAVIPFLKEVPLLI